MSTPIFCLALRTLHDPALRQALLVDSQPMNRLEGANLAIFSGDANGVPGNLREEFVTLITSSLSGKCRHAKKEIFLILSLRTSL